jgi:hypothetical protein
MSCNLNFYFADIEFVKHGGFHDYDWTKRIALCKKLYACDGIHLSPDGISEFSASLAESILKA